jgi:hypothetical protein
VIRRYASINLKYLFILACLMLVWGTCWGWAATNRPGAKVIVLVVDGATWQELRAPDLPNFPRFLDSAAVGLMNTKNYADPDPLSVWVTLGAGRGAVAQAQDFSIFSARTIPASKEESSKSLLSPAVMLQWQPLVDANQLASTQAIPGLLGETLKQSPTAAVCLLQAAAGIGPACLFAADKDGHIPAFLDISRETEPFQHKALRAILKQTDYRLVIVNAGLFKRVHPEIYPLPAPAQEHAQLQRIDRLLEDILSLAGPRDLVVLLTPSCPNYSNREVRTLAPIALRGPGFGPGVLISPSTRRCGLVSNVDFAPTVLTFLHQPVPEEMIGRALSVHPSPTRLAQIDRFDRQMAATFRVRYEMGRTLGRPAAMLLLALLMVRFVWRKQEFSHKLLVNYLLWLFAAPVAIMLVGGLFLVPNAVTYALGVAVLAIVIALLSARFYRENAPGAICLFTAIAFLVDIVSGANLMVRSVLGSDVIVSGRFYGYGNHEAGLLISAALLAAGMLLGKNTGMRRTLGWLLLCITALAIGAPILGANWGQGLSAAIAGLALWFLLAGRAARQQRLLLAVGLFLLTAAAFIIIDLLQPASGQSHLGLLIRDITQQGPGALTAVVKRKLGLAIYLSRLGLLLPVSIVVFATLIVIPLRPPRRLRPVFESRPAFALAIAACGIGALAASVLNDSGVISGLAICYYGFISLLYLGFASNHEATGH